MNETELDELLDLWTAPPVRDPWRRRVCERLAAEGPRLKQSRPAFFPRPAGFAGIFAGTAAGLLLCFVLLARAYPQVFAGGPGGIRLPFIAESKILVYDNNGVPSTEIIESSLYKGAEVLLEETSPEFPLRNLVRGIADGIQLLLVRFAPYPTPAERRRQDDLVRAGCVTGSQPVVHDQILGYPVTVVQDQNSGYRSTWAFSPDLGCFVLRLRIEALQPDGSYHPERMRETIKVTMACRTRSASGSCVERFGKYPFQ